jgi:hypothetical protein
MLGQGCKHMLQALVDCRHNHAPGLFCPPFGLHVLLDRYPMHEIGQATVLLFRLLEPGVWHVSHMSTQPLWENQKTCLLLLC